VWGRVGWLEGVAKERGLGAGLDYLVLPRHLHATASLARGATTFTVFAVPPRVSSPATREFVGRLI
jgi:hypothetical protein